MAENDDMQSQAASNGTTVELTVGHALELAVERHRAGNLDEAESIYRQVLAHDPGNADALHLTGVVAFQRGDAADGVDLMRRAVEINPQAADMRLNLGNALRATGAVAEAEASYRQAVRLDAASAEAHNNLGTLLTETDRVDEALQCFETALAIHPRYADAHNNLGVVLGRMGRAGEAEAAQLKAIEIDPGYAEPYLNLALTQRGGHRLDAALNACRTDLAARVDDPVAYDHLGILYSSRGDLEDGIPYFKKALELRSDYLPALNNLGSALRVLRRFPEAEHQFRTALKHRFDDVRTTVNLVTTYNEWRRPDQAHTYAHVAKLLHGYSDDQYAPLLRAFRATADWDAVAELGDIIHHCDVKIPARFLQGTFLDLMPMAGAGIATGDLARLHRRWGEASEQLAALEPLPPRRPRPHDGQIRLGFLSSDLRRHAVTKFLLPLMRNLDRQRFSVYCYASCDREDGDVQAELVALSDQFRFVAEVPDRELGRMIQDDGVDILLELNGHTFESRISLMPYRPAPVQVQWLGYPFTTGTKAVDYIFVDEYVAPTEPGLLVEEPFSLGGSWLCFAELETPEQDAQPAFRRNGHVTFGSQAQPYKFTPDALAAWARILVAVEDARMLFVRPDWNSLFLRQNITQAFARHGVGADRFGFLCNIQDDKSHLVAYRDIDISLDTFPLTGGTTTCESLAMGVPMVTKYGPGFHERMSYGILRHCGLDALCAATAEDYVAIAVDLAADGDRLVAMRADLPRQLRASPLCAPDLFVPQFEAALETIWARAGAGGR